MKHPGQRIAILIDVQNLYHSAKNLYNSRVNFKAILKLAVSQRNLIRAFAYVVRTKTEEEKPFFNALIKLGFETRVRDLQEFYDGLKKADWDVGITIDAIRISPTVDTIVLVSGDGDFIQLVEYLKNQGKRVEIIAFNRTASSKLQEIADEFINLEDDLERYLLKK
jgi:uncharacterized protein (TIGR00288 family)